MKTFIQILGLLAFTTFFSNCGTSDNPCEDVFCDQGKCINGDCECYRGYTGSSCEKEMKPSSINFNKITIIKFPPLKSNGETWDEETDNDKPEPDLFLKISDLTKVYYDLKNLNEQLFENAKEGQTFELNTSIKVTNFDNPLKIELYDYDVDENPNTVSDFMASITVDLNEQWQGFPTTLELKNTSGNFEILCEISYVF